MILSLCRSQRSCRGLEGGKTYLSFFMAITEGKILDKSTVRVHKIFAAVATIEANAVQQ